MSKADTQASNSSYYVYALCRGDTGEPFYVGKGRGDRWLQHAQEAGRGAKGRRCNTIRALLRRGLPLIKVKVHEGLTEAVAHDYEIALIKAIGRCPAGPLTNRTDGGEGTTGYRYTPEAAAKRGAARRGEKQSPEQIEHRAAFHRGRKRPPQTGEKIAATKRGIIPWHATLAAASAVRGTKSTPEHRAKIAAALRGKPKSPEHRANLANANRGKTPTPEARANMSAAQLGKKRGPHSDETRAKISATKRRRAAITDSDA